MTLDQWDKLSSTIVSFVTVVAIFSGGLFALIEYYGQKTDKKQSRSLTLVSEYHSRDTLIYRNRLDDAWEVGYPVLILTLNENSDKSAAFNSYVNTLINEEQLSKDIDYLMGFYERLVTCVKAKLCDKTIIDKFFLKNGRTFFRKYYPYVCSLRLKWKDESIWSNTEKYFNPGGVGKICI